MGNERTMGLVNYLIFLLPLAGIMIYGFYSRKYIRGVVDFLSAGRLCGRYLLTVGDIANGISIVGVLSAMESKYQVGYAVDFWAKISFPVTIAMALTGYCVYRFRETRAQSIGQFLEVRYGSSKLRIYFSGIRVFAEMLAHSIMPAIAARFFVYFLGLPEYFHIFGLQLSTYVVVMFVCISFGITLICFGGTLTMILTDTLQGFICIPIMLFLGIFLFTRFSWSSHVLPVLIDHVAGESFIDSFDVSHIRDFNLFSIVVSLTITILNRAAWLGGGASGSAKTPHEQKMANLLGTWRNTLGVFLFVVLALGMMVFLNHSDFAPTAKTIRTELACRVAKDIVSDPETRAELVSAFEAIPEQVHQIGVDKPLSRTENLETVYFDTAKKILNEKNSNLGKPQEFVSLYRQQMISVVMRHLLSTRLMGLFALLMVLAMVSTDDSYIFSSSQCIAQDLILPFFKKPPSARMHINILRFSTIGVGVFFLICSLTFAQMDFIEMFRMTVLPMYLGGSGPVLIFGLYSRFGTRQGAWTSILSGTVLAVIFIILQRTWATILYPWLELHNQVERVGYLFDKISSPLHPYVVWQMNPDKFPINSFESSFMIMMTTFVLYIIVSLLTKKEPYPLERMLHRGIYSDNAEEAAAEAEKAAKQSFTQKVIIFLTGITPWHSKADKVISWAMVLYSYVYVFLISFVGVAIWNMFSRFTVRQWGIYFFIEFLGVPMAMAAITAVWFWIGGIMDWRDLLRNLKNRDANALDNGMVVDGVSTVDYEKFSEIEKNEKAEKDSTDK